MSYDDWKTTEPQEFRDYEESDSDRLPCGCIGQCDPYAHDTAPDWDGKHDAIYPVTKHREPYYILEEMEGWTLYDEDDRECDWPLRTFKTLLDAEDWIDCQENK